MQFALPYLWAQHTEPAGPPTAETQKRKAPEEEGEQSTQGIYLHYLLAFILTFTYS